MPKVSDLEPIGKKEPFLHCPNIRLSNHGVPPAGAYLSLERMKHDPRAEPEYGERVPYIIAYNGFQTRLVDCARSPEEFVLDQ